MTFFLSNENYELKNLHETVEEVFSFVSRIPWPRAHDSVIIKNALSFCLQFEIRNKILNNGGLKSNDLIESIKQITFSFLTQGKKSAKFCCY